MKKFLKNVIFSILVVGAILLSAEIPLRIFWYSPPPMPQLPPAPPIVSDPITGEGYYDFGVNRQAKIDLAEEKKAQQEAPPQAESASYEQKTASQTTPSERQPSYRILVLGDSFTFGIGVKTADRFTSILNNKLGNKVEVINSGRGGWGTATELLYFVEEGYKSRPNMVICQFFWNDFLENMITCSQSRQKFLEKGIHVQEVRDIDKVIDSITVGMPGKFFQKYRRMEYSRAWLHHHCSLFNALRAFLIKSGILGWKPIEERIYEKFVKPLDVNLTLDLIKQLRDKVKEKGSDKFLVAVVPSNGHSLPAEILWPALKDLLDKEHIPYIHPSDEFIPQVDTYYIPVDGHFSIEGNRRFAEHLYKLVISLEPSLARPQ